MTATKKTQRAYEEARRQIDYEEAELSRIVATSFTLSCMSDSKWRRLFNLVAHADVQSCTWKFVADDRRWTTRVPNADDLEHGYYENAYGCFRLAHIEWIELNTDNPTRLLQTLKLGGEFETQTMNNGIRVFGYR
jgi:hypothetical protein